MPGPPESSPLARDLQSSRIEAGPQCPDVQSVYYFKAGPGGNPASIPDYTICYFESNPRRGVCPSRVLNRM